MSSILVHTQFGLLSLWAGSGRTLVKTQGLGPRAASLVKEKGIHTGLWITECTSYVYEYEDYKLPVKSYILARGSPLLLSSTQFFKRPPPLLFFLGGHLIRCLRRPVLIMGKSVPWCSCLAP